MKDKEIIEEMANISTKEEIEARNKRGKEKDELRQALLHYATAEASGGIKSLIDCEGCAFYLYENLGYRKIPEDSVVLSREEYNDLILAKKTFASDGEEVSSDTLLSTFKGIKEQARKETAEKILKFLDDYCDCDSSYLVEQAKEYVAKQFGVEVEE